VRIVKTGSKLFLTTIYSLFLVCFPSDHFVYAQDPPVDPPDYCPGTLPTDCGYYTTAYVYICWAEDPFECDHITETDVPIEADYVPQVLANEWHWESQDQALMSGAMAIRTFAQRNRGCGAIECWKTGPYGSCLPVENSWAQRYWLYPESGSGQNTITSDHTDAVNATAWELITGVPVSPAARGVNGFIRVIGASLCEARRHIR